MIQIPSSSLIVLEPAQQTFEEHFVIRFPPGLAASVRSDLQETGLPGDLEISFNRNVKLVKSLLIRFVEQDARMAKVKFDGRVYSAVLCDLPTILESLKTSDGSQYTKVADIHQVLLVLDGPSDQMKQRIEQLRAADYQLDDGLTAPMTDCRHRRFSTKAHENAKRMEEIEERVKALIQADESAIASNYTLYDSRNRPVSLQQSKRKGSAKAQEAVQVEEVDQDEEAVEHEEDSGDSDFAAELEEDLLDDLDVAMDDDDHGTASQIEDAMTEVTLHEPMSSSATIMEAPVASLPPELINLQRQINEKRAQLDIVSNPAIRERLAEALRYLENQLETKLQFLKS